MNRRFRFIALAIVIIMVVSLVSGFIISGVGANAQSVESMQKELDELAKKKEELERQLNVISEKKEKELEKKSLIDEQINATRSEINVLNNVISSLDSELDAAEAELESATKLLDDKLKLSKERIRSAYEQGQASYIEIIFQAKSIHDFISRVEIVSQIAENDRKIINQVIESKKTIEEKKKQIEQNKIANEEAAQKLKSKQSNLSKKQQESDKLIDEMNSDAAAKKRAVIAAEKAEEQLQREILSALSTSNSSPVVDTGEFRWPLNSRFNNITSVFGYRTHPVTGVYKLHTGVDIASSGINGSSIMAAKGGKVIKAGYNRGYGNYIVIDHGGGYATLYGHASSLLVSVGQTVAKGDTIARVGSSGYSTGPHLHFEIIKNGEYTNPLGYFSGAMSFTYY